MVNYEEIKRMVINEYTLNKINNVNLKVGVLAKKIQLFYYNDENFKEIKERNVRSKAMLTSYFYYEHVGRLKNEIELKRIIKETIKNDLIFLKNN